MIKLIRLSTFTTILPILHLRWRIRTACTIQAAHSLYVLLPCARRCTCNPVLHCACEGHAKSVNAVSFSAYFTCIRMALLSRSARGCARSYGFSSSRPQPMVIDRQRVVAMVSSHQPHRSSSVVICAKRKSRACISIVGTTSSYYKFKCIPVIFCSLRCSLAALFVGRVAITCCFLYSLLTHDWLSSRHLKKLRDITRQYQCNVQSTGPRPS